MPTPVIMPRQGQSVESCIITRWFKKPGEEVKKGELLFAYETDKAAFDEEAHETGVLLEVFYQEGEEVPVLTSVAAIGQVGENAMSLRPGIPQSPAPDSISTASFPGPERAIRESGDKPSSERKKISPRARKIAQSFGIDPCKLEGSGPMGRVIARDVEQAKGSSGPVSYSAPALVSSAVSYTYAFEDRAELKKISNVRKIIAANMQASLQNSAQLTHHLSADARRMLAIREKSKSLQEKGSKENITLNDMVCYAVVKALRKSPEVNAHFLGEQVKLFTKVHLGMAVDTPRGLMVPVLRNADDYSIQGLSQRLKELAENCKKGNIAPELLAGTSGTFTVSNLGAYGIELFTPVLNLPQVGILGVNTISYRPADLGGTIGFIPVIGLSLTYDHRAIDGAPASVFLREIKQQIESLELTLE